MKIRRRSVALGIAALVAVGLTPSASWASQNLSPPGQEEGCSDLPSHGDLKKALTEVVSAGMNGGLSNHMWATVVNRDGYVCAVAFSGGDRGDQWPGSRIISAQKAYTANAFSLPPGQGGLFPGLSLATANLYSATQPGGSLFGLQFSNPVDPRAYDGDQSLAGQPNDPLVGKKIGGVNVFGGGLALYDENGIVGALGESGDTSCTDHIDAWKTRDKLGLDHVPNGLNPPTLGDNILPDSTARAIFGGAGNVGTALYLSPTGFGHPDCDAIATAVSQGLPVTNPLTPAAGGGVQPLAARRRARAERLADRGVGSLLRELRRDGDLSR